MTRLSINWMKLDLPAGVDVEIKVQVTTETPNRDAGRNENRHRALKAQMFVGKHRKRTKEKPAGLGPDAKSA